MKKLLLVMFCVLSIFSMQPAIATLATTGSLYLEAESGSYVGGGIGANSVTWTHGN